MADPEGGLDARLSLLNVFEVVTEGVNRHLICFLDPILAGARGIDERSIVGEFKPGPDNSFDPDTFVPNGTFIEALIRYMNEQVVLTEALRTEAAQNAGGSLFILDPRCRAEGDEEPPEEDVLGAYSVDDDGEIVPDSFEYNDRHHWFHPGGGVSGVLSDRTFYDWLHPMPQPEEGG